MSGWMYMLRCSDGSYYVGSTTELEMRIHEHEEGVGASYTAKRRPLQLVYTCEFDTVEEAYERENQVKGWSRAKKEALIREGWDALPRLSQRRTPNRGGPFPEALEGNGRGAGAVPKPRPGDERAAPRPSRASGNSTPERSGPPGNRR